MTMARATEIDITVVSLRASESLTRRALALLDERERASAARRERDAERRYVVAHAAARVVIGARLDCDPAAVTITVDGSGRPEVAGIAFSLSHSADRAAIAIAAPGARLGGDLERVRPRAYLDRLAMRAFAPEEYARWQARPPSQRPRAFAQRWTEIEAVLKARGTGIAGGLASGRVPPPGWSCVPFEAGRGYAGAIAADSTPIAVARHRLQLADALTRRGGTAR